MKLKTGTHDIGLHLLVIFVPYRWWLKIHEQNAIWAGLTPESERGSCGIFHQSVGESTPSGRQPCMTPASIHFL